MPAKSKAQQEYFAIAEHAPKQLRGPVPKMTRAQMREFAATPRTALPERVRKKTPRAPSMPSGPGNRYDSMRKRA